MIGRPQSESTLRLSCCATLSTLRCGPRCCAGWEETIKRTIGALVWFTRASRPTQDGLARFWERRVNRIREAREAAAGRQEREEGR